MSKVLASDGLVSSGDEAGFLSKERIIAGPGFNRWLVPPRRPSHPPVHRHGLRLFGVLAAAF
jgi:hypothetical protein